MKPTIKTGLTIGVITCIVLISFRGFAAYLTRRLNSDNALHILMAHDFQFPGDLYYWGQDRLGSIVPMVGHGLIGMFGLEPTVAVSIAQYFFLFLGFICFASLFKDAISKLIFAFAWFLPFEPFQALVKIGQPYSPQFAFIGLATVLFNTLLVRSHQFSNIQKHAFLSAILLSLFASLWISDFSIVPIFTFIVLGGIKLYQEFKPTDVQNISSDPDSSNVGSSNTKRSHQLSVRQRNQLLGYGVNIALTSALGIAFILYAKANADSNHSYTSLNSPSQILHVLGTQLQSFINGITFQAESLWFSLFNWCLLVLVLMLIFGVARSPLTHPNKPTDKSQHHHPEFTFSPSIWFYFFLTNSVMGFGLLLLSNWVYSEEVGFGPRYFTFVYITLWLAILFLREGLSQSIARRLVYVLLIGAIAASLTLPDHVYALQKSESKYSQLQALEAIAPAGIIGNYWSSPILCIANPESLKCTKHDQQGDDYAACLPDPASQESVGGVRCRRCVEDVFNSPKIYLVKDKWFDDQFPREIQQFRRCLVAVDKPFKLAGYTLRQYEERPK